MFAIAILRMRPPILHKIEEMSRAFFCALLVAANASAATAIHEERFISIGGNDQWVTIHGTDRARPVVLFLHGGPESLFRGWEKNFTLVRWDGPSIEPAMTVDR